MCADFPRRAGYGLRTVSPLFGGTWTEHFAFFSALTNYFTVEQVWIVRTKRLCCRRILLRGGVGSDARAVGFCCGMKIGECSLGGSNIPCVRSIVLWGWARSCSFFGCFLLCFTFFFFLWLSFLLFYLLLLRFVCFVAGVLVPCPQHIRGRDCERRGLLLLCFTFL